MNVVDLFCGAGGLSEGFQQANHNIVVGVDFYLDALKTFRANHKDSKVIYKDMKYLKVNEINELGLDIDVVLGGPPCQGFSIANHKRFIEDSRNSLYKEFVRIVEGVQPKWFVMENVPSLLLMKNIKEQIIYDFKNIGYKIKCKVLCSADYGVAQLRRRVFFIGNNTGSPIIYPKPTHSIHHQASLFGSSLKKYVTIGEALHYEGEKEKILRKHCYEWQEGLKPPPSIKKKLQDGTLTIISHQYPSNTILANTGSWNLDGPYLLEKNILRRLTWNECASIQSFPDNYSFYGTNMSKHKQVGNAVPPLLAKAIANQLKT